MTGPTPPLGKDGVALAGIFLASGVLHLLRPEPFEAIVPRMLPARRSLVYLSGAAEIACAVGLLVPRTRRVAGLPSAALLVGVWPANVTMAVRAGRRVDRHPGSASAWAYLLATIGRLPLQWPMIRSALRVAGKVWPRSTSSR